MSSPREFVGLVDEYPFRGQARQAPLLETIKSNIPISASTVAVSTAARLLRMDDEEFFKTFPTESKLEGKAKEHAIACLSGCVEAGVDLNTALSNQETSFFSATLHRLTERLPYATTTPKDTQEVIEGIKKLQNNIGGVKETEFLETIGVRIQDKPGLKDFYPVKLENLLNDVFYKYKALHDLNSSSIFFVATAGKTTIPFFSRKDKEGHEFFYLTHFEKDITTGKMEVHDSWRSAMRSLLRKWDDAEYADVSVITLKGLRHSNRIERVQDDKHESKDRINSDSSEFKLELPPERLDEALGAIKAFKALPTEFRLSRWQQMLGYLGYQDEQTVRAASYLNLISSCSNDLQKYCVVLELLSNVKNDGLRKAVSMALVFGNEEKDLDNATKLAKQSILDILIKREIPTNIRSAIAKVSAYVDLSITGDSDTVLEKSNLENEAVSALHALSIPRFRLGQPGG